MRNTQATIIGGDWPRKGLNFPFRDNSLMNGVRLSASGIATYSMCQRKFYHRHIEKLPEKPSPAKVRGSIVHKILDEFFNVVDLSKVQTDKHWHDIWKEFRDILNILLDAEWKLIGDEYPDCFDNERQKQEFLGDTKEILDFYSAKLAFSLSNKIKQFKNSKWFNSDLKRFFYPKDREYKLEFLEQNMIGFVDKTMSLIGGGIAIVDYKTGKTTLPHYIAKEDLKQCKVYAYLWKAVFGKTPKHISVFYLRDGESVYYPIDDDDLEEIRKDVEEIRSKEGVKENFEKNVTRLCGYCDYWNLCFKDREDYERQLANNNRTQ